MIPINDNFSLLDKNYLFYKVAERVRAYKAKNGDNGLIALGIGDVSLPLAPVIADSFADAARKMSQKEGFHGYAPYFGYEFLRRAVVDDYKRRNVTLKESEIFISDGAKSDIANLLDIFGRSDALIPSPAYPAYSDVNVMKGNAVFFLDTTEENGFIPEPERIEKRAYIIYICSPNNPTGIGYSTGIIKRWIDFALETGSVIMFDGAYEAYITGDVPHSVYEIDGAKRCAIEIRSLSKSAGFTGVRCGWSVVPEELKVNGISLNALWQRRQSTKFNGVSYPVQVAAAAALSEKGVAERKSQIDYYLKNARIIADFCNKKNIKHFGGKHSPYIWMKCPSGFSGWRFFDFLLDKAGIVVTPGDGFGAGGEGYVRLTAFNTRENTLKAVERLGGIL